MADRLHRVGKGERPLFMRDGADLFDRLYGADLVVGVHDGDERRLLGHDRAKLVKVDDTVLVDTDVGNGEAVLFQSAAGMQHGVMLDLGGDDVRTALGLHAMRRALDRPVIRFAAARSEVQLGGRTVQYIGYTGTRIVHHAMRFSALGMQARRVAVRGRQARKHSLQHRGANGRRSRMIGVDKT